MTDTKYSKLSGAGGIPLNTEIRNTTSTEAGHTTAQIQHVKLDTGDGTNTQPVSLASTPLPSGAATDGTAITGESLETGGTTILGWLSSIRKKIAALITAMTDGTLRGTVAATQSGTWTVQPGNVANTTAWKVDGSGVTQPVSGTLNAAQSGTWTVQPGNVANTTAWKVDGSGVTQPVSGSLTVSGSVTASATDLDIRDLTTTDKVSALPYDAQTVKYAKIDPMRQLAVCEPIMLCGTNFSGATKDTNFWAESAGGGAGGGTNGSIAQAGQITLTSGTKTDAYTEYKTIRLARYVAGSANFFRGVVRLPDAGQTNNIRRWGAFTTDASRVPQNGCWFQLNGTTMGVAYVLNGGTPTVVTSTDVALTKDTNVHTYEIWWTNSKIWYFQDDVLKHTVSASTAPWSYMGAFNSTLHNINSGNSTSVDLECRVASIYRYGHIETAATHKNITGAAATVCKYSAGRLHTIHFNNPAAKAVIIYDNTSAGGTIIATVTPIATTSPFSMDYHLNFNTGLTIDTTAGAQNITVVYE